MYHQYDVLPNNLFLFFHNIEMINETTPILNTVAKGKRPQRNLNQTEIILDDASDSTHASECDSHAEPHFGSAEVIRDVIIGLSDGLTVPFALAAGLATLDNSRLVLTAGVAEVVAGSISMALGGYLAGLSEIEHYDAERKRELWEVDFCPAKEEREIVEIFEPYGITEDALQPLLGHLKENKETWVDFMMKFELNLERPESNRTWISALTIGISYFLGGVLPLALFVFGYVKSVLLGNSKPLVGAIQMMIVGSLAAGAAYGVAQLIPQDHF
jgi:VIT1/CCC1 family predicted Fe2+/Mn2+ transporter